MRGTGVLATIGATAPFVSPFGAVWRIMNSFIGISREHTTTSQWWCPVEMLVQAGLDDRLFVVRDIRMPRLPRRQLGLSRLNTPLSSSYAKASA
jgi:hypothetical protein